MVYKNPRAKNEKGRNVMKLAKKIQQENPALKWPECMKKAHAAIKAEKTTETETKAKAPDADSAAESEAESPEENLCPSCEQNGKKVTMTRRGSDAVECPKCNAWQPVKESKELRKNKLKAQMAAIDAEE